MMAEFRKRIYHGDAGIEFAVAEGYLSTTPFAKPPETF